MPVEAGREALVYWRRQVIAARQNWLSLKGYPELRDLAKDEAADCLKHERACTQLIEVIDGKRVEAGELKGDRTGHLTYRVPPELKDAFAFCRGVLDYGWMV